MRTTDARLLLLSAYSTVLGVATEVEVLRAVGIEPTLPLDGHPPPGAARFLHSALAAPAPARCVSWSKRPSVSFDRAAEYYDATRSLSPAAEAQLTAVLAEALIGHGPVLEIGVGTGRIALPLAAAGLDVVGIDLSMPMLRSWPTRARACRSARPTAPPLPFPDDRSARWCASHVFHLVPEWRDATLEVLRVLRPDGVFLWARGGHGAPGEEVAAVFAKAAGIDRTPVGLDQVEGLDAYLRSRDWKGEWLTEVPDDRRHRRRAHRPARVRGDGLDLVGHRRGPGPGRRGGTGVGGRSARGPATAPSHRPWG